MWKITTESLPESLRKDTVQLQHTLDGLSFQSILVSRMALPGLARLLIPDWEKIHNGVVLERLRLTLWERPDGRGVIFDEVTREDLRRILEGEDPFQKGG